MLIFPIFVPFSGSLEPAGLPRKDWTCFVKLFVNILGLFSVCISAQISGTSSIFIYHKLRFGQTKSGYRTCFKIYDCQY